jgi:hypothetical protein
MRNLIFSLAVIVILTLTAVVADAVENQAAGKTARVQMYASEKQITWGPAPPVVPKGAEAAVLDGDPFGNGGSYTLRLKMPDGTKSSRIRTLQTRT